MDSAARIGLYFLTKLQHGESKLIIAVPIQFGLGGFSVGLFFGFFLIFESDKDF